MRLKFTIGLSLFALFGFSQVTMERTDQGVLIKEGNNNVLFYQTEPKSRNGEFSRNNYIHPLWGIDGKVLTEDFPEDHLHQRGIFWAWHQILINSERIGDGWEIRNYKQDVNEIEFLVNKYGQGILKTEVVWKSDVWRKSNPYLKEKNKITVFPKQGNIRRIDFELSLQALVVGLSLGGSEDEKGYGGFSARFILPGGVQFSGQNGKIQPETNAVEAGQFVNISGAMANNGKNGGIVIISNPENPGFPNSWILREKESMQNAKWPGREPVEISTSEPTVFKYSLLLYKGKIKNKKIERVINQL
ncbi:MAG: PmoA family protein [Prolixibacteraceae bacterium]|nr:PmoA family protein [Prolixibacteraceae bacterium]MBN2774389.1 PmoA family protein [Prolixibacteraceae bacterium]